MLTTVTPALILQRVFLLVHTPMLTENTSSIYGQNIPGRSPLNTHGFTFHMEYVFKCFAETANIFIYGGIVYIGWLKYHVGVSKDNGIWENEVDPSDASDAPIRSTWSR